MSGEKTLRAGAFWAWKMSRVSAVPAGSLLEIRLSSATQERHTSWVPGPGFGVQEGPEYRIPNLDFILGPGLPSKYTT